MKTIWVELLARLGLKRFKGKRTYELDASLETALVERALKEQRPVEEVHADLVAAGLAQRQRHEDLWRRWQTLTPNEHKVIAFTCLGYTNRQIAANLGISCETVNWYIRNLLVKLAFHNKYELTMHFKGWDFKKMGPEAQD